MERAGRALDVEIGNDSDGCNAAHGEQKDHSGCHVLPDPGTLDERQARVDEGSLGNTIVERASHSPI